MIRHAFGDLHKVKYAIKILISKHPGKKSGEKKFVVLRVKEKV